MLIINGLQFSSASLPAPAFSKFLQNFHHWANFFPFFPRPADFPLGALPQFRGRFIRLEAVELIRDEPVIPSKGLLFLYLTRSLRAIGTVRVEGSRGHPLFYTPFLAG
jgi:hypothetical protein